MDVLFHEMLPRFSNMNPPEMPSNIESFGYVCRRTWNAELETLNGDKQSNLYITDTDEMQRIGNRWALGFVGLGICALIGHVTLATGFSVAGERLTRTMRNMAFKAMVNNADKRVKQTP